MKIISRILFALVCAWSLTAQNRIADKATTTNLTGGLKIYVDSAAEGVRAMTLSQLSDYLGTNLITTRAVANVAALATLDPRGFATAANAPLLIFVGANQSFYGATNLGAGWGSGVTNTTTCIASPANYYAWRQVTVPTTNTATLTALNAVNTTAIGRLYNAGSVQGLAGTEPTVATFALVTQDINSLSVTQYWYWNPNSTATANGINVVDVQGYATGRWMLLSTN